MLRLVLQICAIYLVEATENPIPSSFLQPRDFNPHPYQVQASNFLIAPEEFEDYRTGYERKYQELARQFQKYYHRFFNSKLLIFISFYS